MFNTISGDCQIEDAVIDAFPFLKLEVGAVPCFSLPCSVSYSGFILPLKSAAHGRLDLLFERRVGVRLPSSAAACCTGSSHLQITT